MPVYRIAFCKTILSLAVMALAINPASTTSERVAPPALEHAASHIEAMLAVQGYGVERRQYEHDGRQMRSLEVSLINVSPDKLPDRIFIIGTYYDVMQGGATAAMLELARMLKGMPLSLGTEVRFVFFVNDDSIGQGNFIAFFGAHGASQQVRKTLASLKATPHRAMLHYPYHRADQDPRAESDYQNTAHAVEGLARVIKALAGPVRM